MNKPVQGAIVFSALAVGATIDAAVGLGGVQWLADLCLTDESAMGDMDMAPREVKLVPLIGLSLGVTLTAIGLITLEQNRNLTDRRPPDAAEQAAVLSAMLLIASHLGRTSRSELEGFYRIATRHEIEPQLLDLAMDRFAVMNDLKPTSFDIVAPETPLGRRRVLAAAMLMARKPEAMTPAVETMIEALILKLGATMDDAVAVRTALETWDADCDPSSGVPLFSLLRDRPLTLQTA